MSPICSSMLSYLDVLSETENSPLLTQTVNKVKEYLLNHKGWGQWAFWIFGKDTQTAAYQAIYDYAFRGLPNKNPITNPVIYIYTSSQYDDLANRIKAFLKEMDAFHVKKSEPSINYWKDKMEEIEGICRQINQTNESNKAAIAAHERATENWVPL